MVILQQIIELLSRPPGSVIYHLLTLFALQIVLALVYARWQRDPNDEAARRMTLAAAGILVARLVFLAVALLVDQSPERARVVLPPLEQAVDTITVALLVWGMAAFAMDRPRLADGVLLASLVVVAVLYLFFFQDWQGRATETSTYIGTAQAYIWGVLQLAILAFGLIRVVMDRASRLTLRPIIIAVVLLAHIANFFNYPELVPSGTDVIYWLRLGYLIAFPLWAVLAYRDTLRGLLTVAEAERGQATQLARNLRLATDVIQAHIPEVRLEQALELATGLVPAHFASIGLVDEKNPQRLNFGQSRPPASRDSADARQINLTDHAAFRLAFEQQRGIELLPHGVGARQVYELSQQLNIGALGPVFIEPLVAGDQCIGFLLLAAPPTVDNWSDRDRAIVPGLAGFIAQAIANNRRMENEPLPRSSAPVKPREVNRDAERDRLIRELAEARRLMATAEERARQAETTAVFLQQNTLGQPAAARPVVTQAEVVSTIESAVSAVLPMLRRKNLTLDLALAGELPFVDVKEIVLRQLVLSLLENSCRASLEDGTVSVRVETSAAHGTSEANGRTVTLAFADSGMGIHAEDRGRVFDSHYYLSGGRPISGLGDDSATMAVIQKLAQASGGDLSLDSSVGEGTTFTLQLPASDVAPVTVPMYLQETAPVSLLEPAPEAQSPPRANGPAPEPNSVVDEH